MPQPSHHCCERTHHCACTVVVALTQIRRLTNGSDHANLIWLITSEVLPPSAIRKREIIVNIFFSVVQQLNLAVGCLIVEVSRSLTHTHTHTRQDSSKRVISSSQRMHLTQRKTLKRRISMFSAGFEPSIPQSSDSITLTYTGRPPKSVVSLLEAVFRRDSWNYHVCYAECRLSLNSRDGKCNTTWSAKKYLNAAGHCWTYTTNSLGKRKFQTDRFTHMTCPQCDSETEIANCTTCGLFPDIIAQSLKIVQEISVRLRAERFKRHRNYCRRKKCGSAWTIECSYIARSVLKTWTIGQSFGSNVYVLIVNC